MTETTTMLSIRHWCMLAGMICLGSVMPGGASFSAAVAESELRCPPTVDTTEVARPVDGWSSQNGEAQRSLRGVSFYSVGKDGREYELAPDDQKERGRVVRNVWEIHRYRDPAAELVLRCHYTDTTVRLSTQISFAINTCYFDAEVTANGKVRSVVRMICK